MEGGESLEEKLRWEEDCNSLRFNRQRLHPGIQTTEIRGQSGAWKTESEWGLQKDWPVSACSDRVLVETPLTRSGEKVN